MAGGSNGYRAALVRRQLTPGLISSLPGTAGLPPFISFSTSYPEQAPRQPQVLAVAPSITPAFVPEYHTDQRRHLAPSLQADGRARSARSAPCRNAARVSMAARPNRIQPGAVPASPGTTISIAQIGWVVLIFAFMLQPISSSSRPISVRSRPSSPSRFRLGVFFGLIYGLYYYLVQRFDPFHVWLLMATAAVGAAVIAALPGISMAVCLVILMLAPAVTVAGYEVRGYRHRAESLAK